jgi:hypothetical protein
MIAVTACSSIARAGGLCIIHRDAGPEALPPAPHFPRKILVDRRGR